MFREFMTENKPKIVVILASLLLCLPFYAHALGVKEIKVFSALNQPLNARIDLVSVDGLLAQDIKVKLADHEKFQEAGLGRPYFLTKIKFQPVINRDGTAYIQVTSRDIVREPYLDFFIEVSWRDGSIIKEYAILLDPITIQQASVSKPKPKPEPTPEAQAPKPVAEQIYGPVKKAETLWVIAKRTRPDKSIPINKMINAIHKANPRAFVGGDVNLLKQGATLVIPSAESIMGPGYAKPVQQQAPPEHKAQEPVTTVVEQGEPEPTTQQTAPTPGMEETPRPSPMVERPSLEQEKPSAESTTETTPEPVTEQDEEKAELKVVATPESQLKEIMQSEESKAFPKGEIEQLRSSISDTEQDITALNAINQDLVKLKSALEAKIKLVQQELDKTNQAIAIVSGDMDDAFQEQEEASPGQPEPNIVAKPTDETSEDSVPETTPEVSTPTDQTSEIEVKQEPETTPAVQEQAITETEITKPEPTPESEPVPEPKPAPEAESPPETQISDRVIAQIEQPDTESEPAGAEVKTDAAELARIKKLEDEIESLKSQSSTIELLKVVIVALVLAILLAIGVIFYNNRRFSSQASKSAYVKPEFEHLKPHASRYGSAPESSSLENIHADKATQFETSAASPEVVMSQAESPSVFSDTLDTQPPEYEAEKYLDKEEEELPSANKILFESSHEESAKDAETVLTTVDVYLAYRRLTEAESMLHDAIGDHPDNPDLKGKLLEIYAFKKDKKRFTTYLEKYREILSTQAPQLWQNILATGAQLAPEHPLVAEAFDEPNGSSLSQSQSSGPDALVDELVITDVPTPEDELFRVEQDDQEPFDIDLDMDDLDLDDLNKK